MVNNRKRDLAKEIESIQARTGLLGRYEYFTRLPEIQRVLSQITGDKIEDLELSRFTANQELLRYIPIATVACIQSFFRSAIADIIDSGEQFNKNVANYKGKVSPPDFDTIAAIQTNTFTIGEFVAHSLSYSNYEIINSNIKTLLDKDLTQILSDYNRKSIYEYNNNNNEYFKKQCAEIRKSIDITFKMRHTFCHENASNVKFDVEEIKKHFFNCKVFIEYSSEVISNIITPNYPETQSEMNQAAEESYLKKDKELNDLIGRIKHIKFESIFPWNEADNKLFDEIQEKWSSYRTEYAIKSTASYWGSSSKSLLFYSAMKQITDERLWGLKKQYGDLLKRKEEYSFKY